MRVTVVGDSLARTARSGRAAAWAGCAWGFAEGLFFFIVPDVYISYAALFSPRAGAIAWLSSIAGSLAAVLGIWAVLVLLGLDYSGVLTRIPGISPEMLARAGRDVAEVGLPLSPLAILRGVPLKVYAAQALSHGVSLGTLLLWTAAARVVRIAPAFALSAGARAALGRRIDSRPAAWCSVLLMVWTVFYLFYFAALARG